MSARMTQAIQQDALDAMISQRADAHAAAAATWTPERVEEALAEAGRVLLSLPYDHEFPGGFKTAWPEIVRAINDDDWAGDQRQSPPRPSAKQIADMQRRLGWAFRYIVSVPRRRVVSMRMLVDPIHERPWYSWRIIGRMERRAANTVRGWHEKGLVDISRGLQRDGVEIK